MKATLFPIRRFVAMAGAAALSGALAACSGSATNVSTVQALPTHAPVTRGAVDYTFTTVDDTAGTNNQTTGINDDSEIIGVYYAAGSVQVGNSYTSKPYNGSYTTFTLNNWPDAHTNNSSGGTFMTSLATTVNYTQPVAAGYAYDPGGAPGSGNGSRLGVWGIADNQGLWTLIKLHSGQKPDGCIGTQLNGLNAAGYSVGEWADPTNSCLMRAFMAAPGAGNSNFAPTNPKPYVSVATGINDGLYVVGWLQASQANSSTKGWYGIPYGSSNCRTKPYCYKTFTYNNSNDSTRFLGVNKTGDIVGSYVSGGVTHGFLLTSPDSRPTWQNIDETSAKGLTVVSGINDSDDICGWYNDSSGNLHGFVGVASSGGGGGKKHHHHGGNGQ